MAKRKTQEEKDNEYFEQMKESIHYDLKNHRHIIAIMGSIGRSNDEEGKCNLWWFKKIDEYRQECGF